MPNARRRTPMTSTPRPPRASFESLEGRLLFALNVQLDYTYDTNNFFDTPDKRAALEAAASEAVHRYADNLAAIVPGGGNTWRAIIDHPATGGNVEIPNLVVPADTLIVYAGGRQMTSLGIGGPGGFSSSGSTAWNELVAARGQANARGDSARDFGPFGGSITFDTDPAGGWYFGTDEAALGGQTDFFSVALHEMTHLLGFGTSDAWESRASGQLFTGPAAVAEYDGSGNVPLGGDRAHWAVGTTDDGREAAMDPDLTTGQRKRLTPLDLAGMDDIGWEIPLTAALGSATSVTAPGATSTTFTVTYTHYTDIDLASIGSGDVTVTGPNGFAAPATLVSTATGGQNNDESVTATYAIAAPGGTFDGADSGVYSVTMAKDAVGDGFGNVAPAGPLGSFAVDINAPPLASFGAGDVTQLGGADHAVTVTYSDAGGIAGDSLDPADIAVTRTSDAAALQVVAASATGSGNGSPRTVTYTLAAPGGAWDAGDNGTYTVSLVAGQVNDANGNPADAGTLGTFEVSVGAVTFAAGKTATYTDASGDVVTISLKGPGTGSVMFDGTDNTDATGLVVNDATAATTLAVNAGGAGTNLGGVTVNGSLRSFTAKNADLAGAMTVSGSAPKIQFRNASGSIALNAGGAPAAALTLAAARDLSVTSASAVKSIKADEWLDTDATPDVIAAPALASLAIKGAFNADVATDALGKASIGGTLAGSVIRAAGSIGTVTVAAAEDSIVFAGVRPDVSTLPDSLDDFANPAASIKGFTVKGKLAPFSNTRVAAPTVGKATLGGAPIGTSVGNPYGLAADRIASVTGSTSTRGAYKLARLDEPGSGLGEINFQILVL